MASRHHRENSTDPAGTLSPLPNVLSVGLIPVATFGLLSFFAATLLWLLLSWRMWRWWNRPGGHINQFVCLIWNLLLADITQSMAFMLNMHWLTNNAIEVGTTVCVAQGWFISTGDMASGAWSFAIGIHTFASVIFDYRLSNVKFAMGMGLIWLFVYAMAFAGVLMHKNLYVRAVSWCWVNAKFDDVRLYLHYIWIFLFEFGTLAIYIGLVIIVRYRVRHHKYNNPEKAQHAKDASKLMVAYPTIYVFCTLPLATLRMIGLQSDNVRTGAGWFCFAGAMITSNGWLDVLLYTMTRRINVLSDEPPLSDNGIESFGVPCFLSKIGVFGTEATCEYVPESPSSRKLQHYSQDSELVYIPDKSYRKHATNDLEGHTRITERTTVVVTSSPMTEEEQRAAKAMQGGMDSVMGLDGSVKDESTTHQLWRSNSSSSSGEAWHTTGSRSRGYDAEALEFKSKPAGF